MNEDIKKEKMKKNENINEKINKTKNEREMK